MDAPDRPVAFLGLQLGRSAVLQWSVLLALLGGFGGLLWSAKGTLDSIMLQLPALSAQVDRLSSRVEAVEEAVRAEQAGRTSDLSGLNDQWQKRTDDADRERSREERSIGEQLAAHTAKIDQIERSLGGVQNQIERLEQRIDGLMGLRHDPGGRRGDAALPDQAAPQYGALQPPAGTAAVQQ